MVICPISISRGQIRKNPREGLIPLSPITNVAVTLGELEFVVKLCSCVLIVAGWAGELEFTVELQMPAVRRLASEAKPLRSAM